MTQQPYYPPQQPVTTYPPQPGNPYAQPPAYQGPPQGYQAPQPYGQQPYAPPQPPAQPLATGTLDDYYNQPTSSSGPSIAWSTNGGANQKPLGQTYVGVVARDVTVGDIQQDTDPKTGAGKFYRDGRPRFLMKVPLKSIMGGPHPTQVGPVPAEFPEGSGSWFVRGQSRDELTRAQTAAGLSGDLTPKEGDLISVTLVERRPSRGGGNPANIVQVTYQPGPRWAQGAQAAAPEAVAPSPVPAPVQQPVPPAQQWQPPAQAPQPAYAQPGQAGPSPTYAQPPAQPVQVQQPLTPPAGLDPGQQELLARLQASQQQGQQA